jgi:DNA-binding SARP family transcriptional activator
MSKKYLRQTLWQLQTAMANLPGAERVAPDSLLILSPGWVRANPDGAWWLDVRAFEDAYRLCRDIPGEDLTDQQAQALEDAVALYTGDLIEAWYQDWCIYERDRLQLTYLAMLETLMGYCGMRQFYAKGVAHGQSILRYDPARECTHRQLMLLYYQAGDRSTALRQYDRCTIAMAREFNLQPSRQTIALYQQIRADRLEESPPPTSAKHRPFDEPGKSLWLDLHQRLDQIQNSLSILRSQVQHELTAISQVPAGD